MAWMLAQFEDLCLGNRYVTTLHCINSALLKLSKIQRSEVVYRGASGGVLPREFWHANAKNFKGGVEFGFMSTTLNRDVAMHYASAGKNSMVLEMQMGMIDRGADLLWVSQYPHEQEVILYESSRLCVQLARRLALVTHKSVSCGHAWFASPCFADLFPAPDRLRGARCASGGHRLGCVDAPVSERDVAHNRGSRQPHAA
eukprot:5872724-Prymnesium_polylepis.2